jgi:hypothetical protein
LAIDARIVFEVMIERDYVIWVSDGVKIAGNGGGIRF